MQDETVEILYSETYLKAIENSVGSTLFNSLFVTDAHTGEVRDVLNDGMYSCAYFVSSVLYLCKMIDRPHATVRSMQRLFVEDPHWQEVAVSDIQPGDVVVWERITFEDGSENPHIGFALSADEAVSSDYKQKAIARHPAVAGREVEAVYRYEW